MAVSIGASDDLPLHPESLQALAENDGISDRVVFVSGNFNVVHPGHLRLLKFAADCGDRLVVGVLDSTSPGAMVEESLRLEAVRSISMVSHAFILRDPPERFVRHLKPAVVVKGKEHELHENPEFDAVQEYGGKLLFSS